MPIPDFQTLMRPILEFLSDGKEHTINEIVQAMSDRFDLTQDERNQRVPGNQKRHIYYRASWARSHLRAAGLVENPRRGIARLTPSGFDVLKLQNETINPRFLRRYPSYLEFIGVNDRKNESNTDEAIEAVNETNQTPLELMENAYLTLRHATVEELIARLKSCTPIYFESIVVKLLVAMGYGGTSGQGFTTRYGNDSGVDGVIEQDKLGLEKVVVQAKRWESTVGRPIIQAFVGSMFSYSADKGVIISTSSFTKDAIDYTSKLSGKKVVLVDGQKLAQLMIDHNLGVTIKMTYELKEVSNDFFDEE